MCGRADSGVRISEEMQSFKVQVSRRTEFGPQYVKSSLERHEMREKSIPRDSGIRVQKMRDLLDETFATKLLRI